MIVSMAGFAIEDSFIKLAASFAPDVPVGQWFVTVAGMGMAVFGLLTVATGQTLFTRDYFSKPLIVRGVFEVLGRLAYSLAFILTPLITATAILQATPLVVMAGAAIFLKESVKLRHWIAVFCGFVGVMLILQPWGASFNFLTILAVIGMIGFAGRDVATRASPMRMGNFQLGFIGYSMFAIAGLIMWLLAGRITTTLPLQSLMFIGVAGIGGIVGYYALTVAMRTGEVGAVTPWRYSRLIIGALIAWDMFGERMDTATLIGSTIVVLSGISTFLRFRR